MKMTIKNESAEAFFERGKKVARLADLGKSIPESLIISFDDPNDFSCIVSPAKLALIAALRGKPLSITDLALKLHRDRSAVKRDITLLDNLGIVTVNEKVNPGHGKIKEVRVTSERITFSF